MFSTSAGRFIPREGLKDRAADAQAGVVAAGQDQAHTKAKQSHRTFGSSAAAAAAAVTAAPISSSDNTMTPGRRASLDTAWAGAAAACASHLRTKWPGLSLRVQRPYNVSNWFDDYDIGVLGHGFLGLVLDNIVAQNEADVANFAAEWRRKHPTRFAVEIIGPYNDVEAEDVFTIADRGRRDMEFMRRALVQLKNTATKGKWVAGGEIPSKTFQNKVSTLGYRLQSCIINDGE
jgi:hypothetical protein